MTLKTEFSPLSDAPNFNDYAATRIFPIIEVPHIAGNYFTFSKNVFLANTANKWIPGTIPPVEDRVGLKEYEVKPVYGCQFRALEVPISQDKLSDEVRKYTKEYIMTALLSRMEKEFVYNFMKRGVWASDVKNGVAWDDYANSDPYSNIMNAMYTIKLNTGIDANTIAMSSEVAKTLSYHPQLMNLGKRFDRFKFSDLFGLHVIESRVSELDSDMKPQWVFGDNVWVGYVPQKASLFSPMAGFTAIPKNEAWDGPVFRFITIPDDRLQLTYLQGFTYYDQAMVSQDLGVRLEGTLSHIPDEVEPKVTIPRVNAHLVRDQEVPNILMI